MNEFNECVFLSAVSHIFQSEMRKSTSSFHDADILEKVLHYAGDLGRYQKLLIVAMMPLGFTFAYIYFVQMFITVTPQNYWCRIPELANLSMELR